MSIAYALGLFGIAVGTIVAVLANPVVGIAIAIMAGGLVYNRASRGTR